MAPSTSRGHATTRSLLLAALLFSSIELVSKMGRDMFTIDARRRIGDFSFLGRLEYRRDQSDTRFFETS